MSQGSIYLFSQDVAFTHPQEEVAIHWITETLQREEKLWSSINVIFCSDEFLLQLNQEYLKHDYYTDILTFQYEHDPIEGELYISIDRVKANAHDRNIKWPIELHRVIIHGVLHLAGYSDKSEEEIATMRQKEDQYLARLTTPNLLLTLDKF